MLPDVGVPEPPKKETSDSDNNEPSLNDALFDFGNKEDRTKKIMVNDSIPSWVGIWVDAVYNYYFSDLKPQFGSAYACIGERKALFRYKGYEWYSEADLNPHISYD